jgi:hypothetical protein
MGEPRADESSQRRYLVSIASRMQDITKSALNGYYASESLLSRRRDLRLITNIIKLNEAFANVFWKRGHFQHFRSTRDDEGENELGRGIETLPFAVPLDVYSELQEFDPDYECQEPIKGPMTALIQDVYDSCRGPELGTVSLNPRKSFDQQLTFFSSTQPFSLLSSKQCRRSGNHS